MTSSQDLERTPSIDEKMHPGPIPRIAAVNYHHVHDGADDFFRARPETLRQQMELLLAEGFVPTTPSRFLVNGEHLEGSAQILVTFDDAYEDFLLHAWPILRELGIPATLFVIVDAIGGINAWDELAEVEHRHLSLEQLRGLVAEGVEIGSHGRSHIPLVRLDDEELEIELRGSRQELERLLGVEVASIAYPGGAVDERVRRAASRVYELGFATDSPKGGPCCDPFLIPRFDPCFFAEPDDFRRELTRHGARPPASGSPGLHASRSAISRARRPD